MNCDRELPEDHYTDELNIEDRLALGIPDPSKTWTHAIYCSDGDETSVVYVYEGEDIDYYLKNVQRSVHIQHISTPNGGIYQP